MTINKYRNQVSSDEYYNAEADESVISVSDVKDILDEIEDRVNEIISKFTIENLLECIDDLRELSRDLY